ncbi:MAG: SEL1-like repeat protein [Henriciella sp.]|nr:SEL1-like repeat protein [Henriciella sp.]MBO6694123.1 SEL1-like repeat protein [Henriciella sp.]
MSQYGSWSVKGVDDRARAVAKEKARLKGVTLGDYINNLLLDGHSEAGPRDLYGSPFQSERGQPHHSSPLDSLAQRIEAVEARSTLAITGIDQSVLGMLARLEGTENSTAAMAAEVEGMIDELRETHENLHAKVGALEADNSGHQNLEAMKALEDALGRLASHVYEEGRLTQDETTAMKGRVEAGFNELSDRVEGIEVKVESTLASAAQRVEKAVEQAELRAEGTSRHLSERFSAIESTVASKLAKVDEVDARMNSVEGDVSGAITSMESTLSRIQDRLSRAEMTTDTALKALEQTFSNLDERIDTVAEFASPEKADALRQELEQRFDDLATDLRTSVEQTRQHLAAEIERAAARANPELVGELEARISTLEADNPAEAVNGFGDQIARLSSSLDQRIVESESRSATAIEQVGEQVASAIKHVQARQEQGQRELEQKVDAAEERQSTKLSEALNNVSDRLAEMQTQTATAVSPVQKAILSLASRLEALEDFTAPPLAETEAEALPDMPEMSAESEPLDLAPAPEPEIIPDLTAFEPEPAERMAEEPSVSVNEEESEDYDFIAGLPDFDDEPSIVGAEAEDPDSDSADTPDGWDASSVDDNYMPDAEAVEPFDPFQPEGPEALTEDPPEEIDPLAELGSWDDAQQEARDSDVFSEDDAAPMLDAPLGDDDTDALAHNLEDDFETDLDEAPLLEPDDEATDYLSRARQAAIAASETPNGESRPRLGRRSAASTPPKSSSGGRKVPVIAAASVLALAAAGAGGWVALRGKTNFAGGDNPSFAATTGLADRAAAEQVEEPSLTGIEFAEEVSPLDETLFEEEGSVAGMPDAELEASAPTEVAVNLPEIPKALSLERAAIEGNPIAQFKWGEARLAAQDLAAGADFIRRAARQGLPAAQYRLAKLHERGIGVPRDFFEARSWTEKAAIGGNTKAMHDVAVFFADGEGGPQSYAAAAEWFRKAADYGVVDSQYNLAVLYENGLGISPSQSEALYWYEVASANGDASAPGNVATLREALPLEQAQQAQRRASSWSVTPADTAANGQFGMQDWERSTRAQVATLQTVMNGLGYDTGTPDGIAGAGTRAAVQAYQADNGLEANGVIDELLIETLNRQTQGLAG